MLGNIRPRAALVFEGQAVGGPFALGEGQTVSNAAKSPLTVEQLNQYLQVAADNVAAIAQGATPSYYMPGLPDMSVNAIVLTTVWGGEGNLRQGNAMHVSVRPGMPLQATLFQMCESVAQILTRQRYTGQFQLGLTIGIDPALQGAGEEVYIDGVDPKMRGFVINDPRHCAIGFMPDRSAEEVLKIIRDRLPIGSRYGVVHSMQSSPRSRKLWQ